jgi:thioredoxin-dependent peroxiredoxin
MAARKSAAGKSGKKRKSGTTPNSATKQKAGTKRKPTTHRAAKKRSGNKTAPAPAALQAGMKAPPFCLPRDGGGTVSLADFAGKKLVLYFYPRADTPGCTIEANDFSKLETAFSKADTQILGVSADPVPAQDKFKAKHKLAFPLASDERHGMLQAYGVWQEKSLYGRKFMGIVRATFLIGPDLQIVKVWPKVSVAGHAKEVLATAQSL